MEGSRKAGGVRGPCAKSSIAASEPALVSKDALPIGPDTFGQVILGAQASGLPVIAVGQGGPAELIDDGRTGVLCPADAEQLGAAVARLAGSPPLARRLANAARAAVTGRSWERALDQFATGYQRTIGTQDEPVDQAA